MCIECLTEGRDARFGKRKRPLSPASAAEARARRPLLLATDDCQLIESSRAAVLPLCYKLPPEESGGYGYGYAPYVLLPGRSAESLRRLADFCQRVHNVSGRPASGALAWRKSIRPPMSDDDVYALLGLAHAIDAPLLYEHCAQEVASWARGLDAPSLRERFSIEGEAVGEEEAALEANTAEPSRAGCALERALGRAGVQWVLETLLLSDGPQAMEPAMGASVAWREGARAALAARQALGLGLSLDEMNPTEVS